MIAADTSSLIAYLGGETGAAMSALHEAFRNKLLHLPPPVITELTSGPATDDLDRLLAKAPRLPITEGFWERAGESRRLLLAKGLKAKMADTLIAQCCIDADVLLIASDTDYRHFATYCGLKLA